MPHRGKVLIAAALASGLALGVAAPVAATAAFQLNRVAGSDRYATAAQAARAAFGGGADDAVLASGQNFPDALAGSYLAGRVDGPLLLTTRDALPDATEDVIDDLGVDRVFVLGGDSAVSDAAVNDLPDDIDVVRVAGDNRFETAAEIATSTAGTGAIGEVSGKPTAFLASGESFADALAAGPAAFAEQFPILLTAPGELTPAARDALVDLDIEHVVIIGGSAAVSDEVEDQVDDLDVTTQRVAGQNRYATATAMANFGNNQVSGWSDDAVDLASGTAFPDALAGGAAAGNDPRALLLTDPDDLSSATESYLEDHAATLTTGRIYGGTRAVSDDVEDDAEDAGQGGGGATTGGEVVGVNTDNNTYTYTLNGAAKTVTYQNDDEFSVGGNDATVGAFEGAINRGDRIVNDTADDSHALTNVEPASINNRIVGNIDLDDNEFDFINEVTGDWVRRNISYAGAAYRVGGETADLARFEGALNEGDLVNITTSGSSTVFALDNRTTTGSADSIDKDGVAQTASFQIGVFGDIPGTGSDTATDPANRDDVYRADGGAGANDTFTIGAATATFTEFNNALTAGDRVSYTRNQGVEHFALVNQAPATRTGTVTDAIDRDGDDVPNNNGTDGGAFTIDTGGGTYRAVYGSSGYTFVVDGQTSNEAEFESALSEGDDVEFRPQDTPTGQTGRIELDN